MAQGIPKQPVYTRDTEDNTMEVKKAKLNPQRGVTQALCVGWVEIVAVRARPVGVACIKSAMGC